MGGCGGKGIVRSNLILFSCYGKAISKKTVVVFSLFSLTNTSDVCKDCQKQFSFFWWWSQLLICMTVFSDKRIASLVQGADCVSKIV